MTRVWHVLAGLGIVAGFVLIAGLTSGMARADRLAERLRGGRR